MRIELEWIDDSHGELAELEAFLRQDPRLDDVHFERGRPLVPPESLGALEILEFIVTSVSLGAVTNALYDFIKMRWRSRHDDGPTHLLLTRTDLPDGTRRIEIDVSDSAETVAQIVRDSLSD